MFKKIWRRLFSAKRPFRLTGPGWVFILYTIGVGAGAINTGNNLLYLVFGVFLGLLLASGFLSDLSLWGLALETTLPRTSEADKPISIFLKLTNNKKWIPSLSVNILLDAELNGVRHTLRAHVPFVGRHQTETTRLEWIALKRGWLSFQNARLSTRYPFGLLEKWWRVGQIESGVFITPKIIPIKMTLLALFSIGDEHFSEKNKRGEGTTLHSIREFTPSDNPRRIHWRASAKRVGATQLGVSPWLVREMAQDQKQRVAFQCPTNLELSEWTEDEIEKIVSFLASVLKMIREQGYGAFLLIDKREVINEPEFLSLWKPKEPLTPQIERHLSRTYLSPSRETRLAIDVIEAYHVYTSH